MSVNDARTPPAPHSGVSVLLGSNSLNLMSTATDENWNQPLPLLARAAPALRESSADDDLPCTFKVLAFPVVEEFRAACNSFGDQMVAVLCGGRAAFEFAQAKKKTLVSEELFQEDCLELWRLVRGGQE